MTVWGSQCRGQENKDSNAGTCMQNMTTATNNRHFLNLQVNKEHIKCLMIMNKGKVISNPRHSAGEESRFINIRATWVTDYIILQWKGIINNIFLMSFPNMLNIITDKPYRTPIIKLTTLNQPIHVMHSLLNELQDSPCGRDWYHSPICLTTTTRGDLFL